MAKHNMNSTHCLLVACLFLTLRICSAAEVMAKSESRGLALDLSVDGTAATWQEVTANCRITNHLATSVPYTLASPKSLGFVIELYDAKEERVALRSDFRRLFHDWDVDPVFWIHRGVLEPEQSLEFRCRLTEVFQIDNLAGCLLKARWDRGDDARGNRYAVDKNLVAELAVPKLAVAAFGGRLTTASQAATPADRESKTQGAPASAQEIPRAKNYTENAAHTHQSLRLWLLLGGVLLVVLLGAYVVVRSQSK